MLVSETLVLSVTEPINSISIYICKKTEIYKYEHSDIV